MLFLVVERFKGGDAGQESRERRPHAGNRSAQSATAGAARPVSCVNSLERATS
jgi:hypothetical protein